MNRSRSHVVAALVGASVALATLGIGPVASAQPASDREALELARELMEQGQGLYLQEDYAGAAGKFMEAFRARPFPAFLFNAGVAMEQGGDYAAAAGHFEHYLREDPTSPDAEEVRERIERLRAEAIEPVPCEGPDCPETNPPCEGPDCPETPPPCEGPDCPETNPNPTTNPRPTFSRPPQRQDLRSLLQVTVAPEGATVTLRAQSRTGNLVGEGPGPFIRSLEEGEYHIRVHADGYNPKETSMRVTAGEVYNVYVDLSQGDFTGNLTVRSNPPGAMVYIDDREAGSFGATPIQNNLTVGTHHIWIERPGYRTEERDIELGVGEFVVVPVDLTRVDFGRLRVVANVRGATVRVNGEVVGQVPFEGDVPSGNIRVRVEADGMKPWAEDVPIRNGQITPIRIRLKPAMTRGGAYATAVMSALMLTGGVILGLQARGLQSDLEDDRDAGTLASNDGRFLRGKLFAAGADVAFAFSALMGVLSIFYFLRDPLPDSEGNILEPRDWALAPAFGPDGGGASLRLRF